MFTVDLLNARASKKISEQNISRVRWGNWETGCISGKILILADTRKLDQRRSRCLGLVLDPLNDEIASTQFNLFIYMSPLKELPVFQKP